MALTIPSFPSYSPDIKFSFTNTEYDLSEYQSKLASRRDANSLFLRRAGLPGMKKPANKGFGPNLETDSNSLAANKMFFIQAIESHDSQQIVSLYSNFPSLKSSYLPMIASDEDILNSLFNAIISFDTLTFEAKSVILDIIISTIMISSEQVIEKLINEIGLPLSIITQNSLEEINNNMLENACENSRLLPLVLRLFQSLTSKSNYSRSAMISFGILNSLVLIASKNVNDDLTNQCLLTIHSIFTKNALKHNNLISSTSPPVLMSPLSSRMKARRFRSAPSTPLGQLNMMVTHNDLLSEIDFEIEIEDVENIIDPLFNLLQIKSSQNPNFTTINLIFNIFVELTNSLPILIKRFYANGLYQNALSSLLIPELTNSSLNLIGNLPVSQSLSFIKSMIENGLFAKLMQIIQNIEYTSDVYWVLSNFLEAAPQFIIPLIDKNLIYLSVGIGEQSSFHIKREIAYFLSTLIITVNNNAVIKSLSNEKIIELIAEMLTSGVDNLMIRCIFAFHKILDTSIQSASDTFNINLILQIFDNCDVVKQLDEIAQQVDQNNTTLISTASNLLFDIQKVTTNQY